MTSICLRAGGLEKFEVPAAVKLCTEVWSPDMGLVTAAFKIKRKDIQERYKEDIKRMYASWAGRETEEHNDTRTIHT